MLLRLTKRYETPMYELHVTDIVRDIQKRLLRDQLTKQKNREDWLELKIHFSAQRSDELAQELAIAKDKNAFLHWRLFVTSAQLRSKELIRMAMREVTAQNEELAKAKEKAEERYDALLQSMLKIGVVRSPV
jgi:hypothetical protein